MMKKKSQHNLSAVAIAPVVIMVHTYQTSIFPVVASTSTSTSTSTTSRTRGGALLNSSHQRRKTQRIIRDLSCDGRLATLTTIDNTTSATTTTTTTTTRQDDSDTTTTNECEPYLNNGVCDSELGWEPKLPECEHNDCEDCGYYCSQFSYDCVGCLMNGCYWCPGDATCYNTNQYYVNSPRPNDEDENETTIPGIGRQYSCYEPSDYIRTGVLVDEVGGEVDTTTSPAAAAATTTRMTISSIEAIEEQCTRPTNFFR